MLCSKLEKIIQHFLQYFKSIDSRQVKAKEMASEVRGIGVAISTQDVSDFLDESKIRESYLGGYCVFRGFQPDSIKKKIESLNEFYIFLLGRKKELKQASNRRFWKRHMEDYQVFVDNK